MINSITEQTGADISIEDDGTIYVGAADGPSAEAAIDMINAIANPQLPKVGERFLGTVVKTAAFGAFVSLLPGRDGLVHISKLGNGKRIGKVEDVVNVGDKLQVEIAEIDQPRQDQPGRRSRRTSAAEARPVRRPASDARGRGRVDPGRSDLTRRDAAGASPAAVRVALRTRGRPGTRGRGPVPRSERSTVLPGGPAGGHRGVPGARVASVGLWVGVGSRDERPRRRARRRALPRAPAVQGHAAPHGAGDRRGDRRRRRRAQRVHRQGVHLLLRARPRQRPAAGGRPGRATWCSTPSWPRADVEIERGRGPRGDRRCATTTPRTCCRRRSPRRCSARHPLGRPVIGTEETITGMSRDRARGFYARQYAPAADGARGRRQRRRTPTCCRWSREALRRAPRRPGAAAGADAPATRPRRRPARAARACATRTPSRPT